MNPLLKVALLLSLAALCAGGVVTTHLRRQPPLPPLEHDLYSTVNFQLAAFRGQDFEGAYQNAASEVQRKFSRTEFELMIRRDFAFLTRTARVEFGAVRIHERSALAQVFLTTSDGLTRAYLFSFVAENRSWRIDGVESLGANSLIRLPGIHV